MKTFKTVFLAFIVAVAASYGVLKLHNSPGDVSRETSAQKESVYERVMRTGTIRCGYGVWPPYIVKSPGNGELSGIFYDYMEKLGRRLSLDIKWTEEMGWGEFPAALNAGRIDVFCSPAWRSGGRARMVDFVRPVTVQPSIVIVKAGDTRFDNNLAALDKPGVTFVHIEGGAEAQLAKIYFPDARMTDLQQISQPSEVFLNITTGKADATVSNLSTYADFAEEHQDKVRKVQGIPPLQLASESITVARGEYKLRRMLEIGTDELLRIGAIDKIIQKYGREKQIFIPYISYKKVGNKNVK